jgi:hypothetical protein
VLISEERGSINAAIYGIVSIGRNACTVVALRKCVCKKDM